MKYNLILAFLASAILCGNATAGEVLDRVEKNKELVVAIDTAIPPTSFLDEQGNLAGFDVDVANEIAKRLDAKARFVTPSWDVMTAGKWSGRWDVAVASMTPTMERGKVLDFPAIYYAASAALVVNSANTTIAKPEDASGKRIGVQGASTYEYYLNRTLKIGAKGEFKVDYKIENAKAVAYDSEGLSLDDLRLGDGVRLDAAIASEQAVNGAIKAGYPIKRVGQALFAEPLAIAIDKGDQDFGQKLHQIVGEMRTDGTLKSLSEKWFKTDYVSGSPE